MFVEDRGFAAREWLYRLISVGDEPFDQIHQEVDRTTKTKMLEYFISLLPN
jgi:hypothetical protein